MGNTGSDISSFIIFGAGAALLPLLLVVTTCFLKMSVVLVITRNALGLQQAPPNIALYAIALCLSVLVMAPVMTEVSENMKGFNLQPSSKNIEKIFNSFEDGAEPLRQFMLKNTSVELQDMFFESAQKLWPTEIAAKASKDDLFIVIPSFVVSELQKAFEIGFLIFVPFLVVDIIVSNILLALGMQMVAPMMISLPMKILLFAIVDGWSLLLNGLLLSYV